MKYKPHGYQDHATGHVLHEPFSALFMDMGLGKTVATATAMNDLMFDRLEADKFLVIAPKRVAEVTWPDEFAKWDHLKHLRLSVVAGSAAQRKDALKRVADVYVIGRDNVSWLVDLYKRRWPFKHVIIDELSSFKNPEAKRFKNLRKVRPLMKRVIGLTGTPASKSYMDLWSQVFLLDRGKRLGATLTEFRNRYFIRGYENYKWDLRPGADVLIFEAIKDICISMKAEDWLDLPGRSDQVVKIVLTPELRAQYVTLKAKRVLQLIEEAKAKMDPEDLEDEDFDPSKVITAANAGALYSKLAQFCNGAVYAEAVEGEEVQKGPRPWHEIHDLKIEAVREDLEALDGQPFLLFYQFQHDLARLLEKLAEFKPRVLKSAKDIADWNEGKIPFLIAHPQSAGHGLNLQDGGNHTGWFGLPWDLEIYLQAIKRLDRQGQKKKVINRMYLVEASIEGLIHSNLHRKSVSQETLLTAVKAMVLEVLAESKNVI